MEKKAVFLLCLFVSCGLICILPVVADDTTPPVLVSTSILDGAVNVPVETTNEITIVFSEPINATYLMVTFQTYSSTGYVNYPHVITVAGDTVTISPSGGMDPWLEYWESPYTGYYFVHVSNIYDLSDNRMESGVQFDFRMEPLDKTSPSVVSHYPADDATNVPACVTITATMSEKINQCTGTVTMVDSTGSPVDLNDDCKDDTYYCAEDYQYLTIQPTSDLTIGETYTVTIQGIEDSYENMMGDDSWSFTVTSPSVDADSVYPADGATNVPACVTITATMNEKINQCTGTVTMVDSTGSPVDLNDDCKDDTYYCTEDYQHLTIQPTSDLTIGETYTVTIQGIQDQCGNLMETAYSWSFTVTSPSVDADSVYPAYGATNVPVDVTITATMNEKINQCTGTVTMVDSTGSPVDLNDDCKDDTYYCTEDYQHLTIQPTSDLIIGETYTVTIQGIQDQCGNPMETAFSWSFTVMTPVETLQDLGAKVDELELPPDIEDGLMAKLNAAEMQIIVTKYTAAEKLLIGFIKQVNSQSGKTIDPTDGDELIAIAQRVIDFLPG